MHVKPAHAVLVNSYDEFEALLIAGNEEFYIEVILNNGTVKGEGAPFDIEDPMSYVLVRVLMQDPQIRIYKC